MIMQGRSMIQVILSDRSVVHANRGDLVIWAKINGKWKSQRVFSNADEAKAYAESLGTEWVAINI